MTSRYCWLDSSLSFRPRLFYVPAACVAALLLACVAIANRQRWCQLQAYVAIALLVLGFALAAHEKRERIELLIKPVRSVFCSVCKQAGGLALYIGSRSTRQPNTPLSSTFEKLRVPKIRSSLLVLTWLLWLAYGALFHEGTHVHAENKAIVDMFGFSDYVPPALRWTRSLLLLLVANLSLVLPVLSAVYLAVFIALLPFPTHAATAQGLPLQLLAARTTVFCTLFILSELFDLNAAHCRWLRSNERERSSVLGVMYSAFHWHKHEHAQDSAAAVSSDYLAIDIDAGNAAFVGRRYSAQLAAQFSLSIMRSAWVLIVSNEFSYAAVAQLVLMCYLIWRERYILQAHIAGKKVESVRIKLAAGSDRATAQCNAAALSSTKTTTTTPTPGLAPASQRRASQKRDVPRRNPELSKKPDYSRRARARKATADPEPTPLLLLSDPVGQKQQMQQTLEKYRLPRPSSACFPLSVAHASASVPSTSVSSSAIANR